jgi:serine/threonine protein kinase
MCRHAFIHSSCCAEALCHASNVSYTLIPCHMPQVSKISDFGLASCLLDGATHRSTQTTGTISHSAPEVLTTGRMSTAADVYSFGIMSEWRWLVYAMHL